LNKSKKHKNTNLKIQIKKLKKYKNTKICWYFCIFYNTQNNQQNFVCIFVFFLILFYLILFFFMKSGHEMMSDFTLVGGLFLWSFGFRNIFKMQGIVKIQKSALLVLRKRVINPPLQSLVNQYFSPREKYWLTKLEQLFSKQNHEK